jgi:hypothetical protein
MFGTTCYRCFPILMLLQLKTVLPSGHNGAKNLMEIIELAYSPDSVMILQPRVESEDDGSLKDFATAISAKSS